MGRHRKIKSVKALEEAWDGFKHYCDNQNVLTHDFSAKNSEFVSAELKRSITYTIEGFCRYIGITRQSFYVTYGQDPRYADIFTRIREECEVDARRKFELGMIPERLAALWMGRYGYSAKADMTHDVHTSEDDPLTQALREEAEKLNADQ